MAAFLTGGPKKPDDGTVPPWPAPVAARAALVHLITI
jgi:hypothetical protein